MEEVGAASFWPFRGGMAEESLGCLVCLSLCQASLPPSAESPRVEAEWLYWAFCKGQAMTGSK